MIIHRSVLPRSIPQVLCLLVLLSAFPIALPAAEPMRHFKFDFGTHQAAPGYTAVTPEMSYSKERGYGFDTTNGVRAIDRGGENPLRGDFITSDRPFYFSMAVPEGNYRVTVTLGDPKGESDNTIKAELRRLMVEGVRTGNHQTVQRTFIVNVRTPAIAGGGHVRLKSREKTSEWWAWDDRLSLEFNGSRPCVSALEIEPADDLPTVYLLGDSTVCDQPREPWASWGQMFTRFFKPTIAIANHAESGETIRGSISAGRLAKVYSLMRPGDYAFAQFGHNDMKSKAPNAVEVYRQDLRGFVKKVRELGGTPVLVTSMERKAGIDHDTLAAYPGTMIEVAQEEKVALIDLHAISKVFYRALGPDLDKAFQDGTHHNNYGSYELAKCIVQGIRDDRLDLARYIVDDFKGFDPAHPDPVNDFKLPASPGELGEKPLGN